MLSHVSLGTNDAARAAAFYDPVLAVLGIRKVCEREGKRIDARLARNDPVRGPLSQAMADLYLKKLEAERKALWATCRLKGLARDTRERQRIVALDEAIAAHRDRKPG